MQASQHITEETHGSKGDYENSGATIIVKWPMRPQKVRGCFHVINSQGDNRSKT